MFDSLLAAMFFPGSDGLSKLLVLQFSALSQPFGDYRAYN